MFNLTDRTLWMTLALMSMLVVLGCEKSNGTRRHQGQAEGYAALNGEDKASVDRGTLREGMTTNAVLIVWGQPTVVSTISTPNGPFVFWEYYRKNIVVEDPQVITPRSPTPVPRSRVLPGIPPKSRVVEWLERTAVFHDERLVNWEPRAKGR